MKPRLLIVQDAAHGVRVYCDTPGVEVLVLAPASAGQATLALGESYAPADVGALVDGLPRMEGERVAAVFELARFELERIAADSGLDTETRTRLRTVLRAWFR